MDSESGGPGSEFSLLTCFFLITDQNLQVVDSLGLALKHNVYKVSPGGMKVNRINLEEHDKVAISPSLAGQKFVAFLKKNYQGEKIIPVGHGLAGDQRLLWDQLLGEATWGQWVSYNGLDTGVLTRWLALNGRIKTTSQSLFPLCKDLGVDTSDLSEHTSEGDTWATFRLYKALPR